MAVVVTVIASGVGSKTVDPDAISSPVEAPLSVDEKAVLRKRKYVAACLFNLANPLLSLSIQKEQHGPTWQAKSMVSSLGGMQINILAHRMQPPLLYAGVQGVGGSGTLNEIIEIARGHWADCSN